ncbi:hypothetical protein [Qipengyuania seohaensis]|uniref:hypothetical protein n=1 Tax=Qipengyuania seohaensis TaxID=266951 RepID=UPI000C222585|nr:hypothetical protein [Qipengyuania seohaensis]
MAEEEREAGRDNAAELLEYVNSYRSFVERGDKAKVVPAVETCLSFGLPIPDWLEDEVRAAVRFYFDKGGAAKRGSPGNRALTKKSEIDVARYMAVERERERKGATLDSAVDAASVALRGTFAQGEARPIKESYTKVAAVYHTARRKPGPKPSR